MKVIFYCRECGEWFEYEDGSYTPVGRESTWEEPAELSDTDCCVKCDAPVEIDCIVDDVLEFLNKKEIKP